ncbi:hypothetical protein [Sphingopyxis terrae]|uniref:DGQHR domain-containing protein n=1 Tax=Sphingopyxis terrae subsp. ummariensis TaxID=429001 RepID=A0A1Y6EJV6_9SPHN|nr:hypothetical protein [Sphingopyxis terrae]PCF93207.1 hypothetical protein CPA46_02815 [Sphingopyxis terrae subsp. ummariensis]SMQ61461.1 hypothetical protein SAMN06295984_0569 [Sphingopyxis terrae subsp. ummariensis]
MKFEVIGIDYDSRINNFMVSARADYEWYLNKTQGSEENLEIQRDIIRGTKPYKNLRADLKMGCILPTIVLAARNIDILVTEKYDKNDGFISASKEDIEVLRRIIDEVTPKDVDIVDGLQRTNALRQTLEELDQDDRAEFLGRSLRLEIWINIAFFPLAYRMLLLNAGQRPMSMKHQIDILSGGLADDLQDLDGIEIIRMKDHKRRVKPGQFHLSTLAQAFQAWMQRSPNVDRTNLVVETMVVDEALESLGIDLSDNDDANQRDGFRQCVDWMLKLDRAVGDENNRFFGNDTVVLGFAAAIGFAHKNETLQDRLNSSMQKMIDEATNEKENPLGVLTFDQIRKSVDTKRSNVGEATRGLVFRAVREYIMQDGTSPMVDCWTQSASMM